MVLAFSAGALIVPTGKSQGNLKISKSRRQNFFVLDPSGSLGSCKVVACVLSLGGVDWRSMRNVPISPGQKDTDQDID